MGRTVTTKRPPRICVVGAGVSGLRAASLLARQGFEVTMFEARDRIGGRICQSTSLGISVDLGPNWMHGTAGNPIVHLAEHAGVATSGCNLVSSIYDSTGQRLPQRQAAGLYQEIWRLLDLLYAESAANSASISPSAKMMDSLRNLVAQGKYDNDTKKTMLHIAEMWGAFMGAECEKQSMKYFWLEEGIEGDNLFVASTYRSIVDQLWQSVSQEVELRLSTEVIQIKDSGPERGVVVKTANGTAAFFDEVVVTLPLGWLKRNQDVICPPLPARISEAINAIGFGNLDKVFVNFPKPFWMVSNNSEKPNGEGSFPIETLFLTPTYASVTNPSCWRQEMVSLASLPKGYAHPTVMFYVYGEWGQHITRLVRSLEQDSPEYHQILKEKFEPYYSKLPNYQEDSPDCRPLRFLSSDWQGDKFAGYGSYCNYQVGLENGAEDIEVLRQGMGLERGIWFAGEHTAPFEGLGTVTGAYWSGERVSRQISELYGRDAREASWEA